LVLGKAGLVFSFASKELATEVLSGVAFHSSRKIGLGDKIRLGDGTTGNVVKVDALETLIKG
jgi:small-conductance mechanosensitive channel